MRGYKLLVWLTQLGLSVALPMGGCVVLGVYLYTEKGWGLWALIAGIVLGLALGIDGLRTSLHSMNRMLGKPEKEPTSVNYNDHE